MGVMAEDKIIMKKISEIRPYVRNPRKNEKTVELLCEWIPKVGFNVPIVIDQNGIIVKGHARYFAAIRLGMEEVPCIISHASEEAIKVDRITDNKIAEYSEWMNEELAEEIEEINTKMDFSPMEFPTVSFADMPSEPEFEAEDEEIDGKEEMAVEAEKILENPEKAPQKFYKFVCKDCGHVMFISEDKLEKRQA